MAIEKDKTNRQLGSEVAKHLQALGLETPMQNTLDEVITSDETKLLVIEEHTRAILKVMGLDLTDDSLIDTPKRVAKMFVNEIFSGLDYANFPKATVIENKMQVDEMVLERDITVNSTCEHHLLSIIGRAHVAYIPNQKVLGLSKLNRIVDFFSRRPQVQERLTMQIHAALCFLLETDNVAVVIEAEHMCVKTRGVQDACSDTVTSKLGGDFRLAHLRAEYMGFVNAPR